jgi:hypothetical protein
MGTSSLQVREPQARSLTPTSIPPIILRRHLRATTIQTTCRAAIVPTPSPAEGLGTEEVAMTVEVVGASPSQAPTAYVVLDPEKVLAAMARKQLTQQQVAKGAGICLDTMRNMVNGRQVMQPTAAAVVRYLNSVDDVVDIVDYLPDSVRACA